MHCGARVGSIPLLAFLLQEQLDLNRRNEVKLLLLLGGTTLYSGLVTGIALGHPVEARLPLLGGTTLYSGLVTGIVLGHPVRR